MRAVSLCCEGPLSCLKSTLTKNLQPFPRTSSFLFASSTLSVHAVYLIYFEDENYELYAHCYASTTQLPTAYSIFQQTTLSQSPTQPRSERSESSPSVSRVTPFPSRRKSNAAVLPSSRRCLGFTSYGEINNHYQREGGVTWRALELPNTMSLKMKPSCIFFSFDADLLHALSSSLLPSLLYFHSIPPRLSLIFIRRKHPEC